MEGHVVREQVAPEDTVDGSFQVHPWILPTPKRLSAGTHERTASLLKPHKKQRFQQKHRRPRALANRLQLLFGMQGEGGNAKTSRTESKGGLTTATLRARRRSSSSGTTGIEDLLHYALVMATIVYPLSLGARAAGKALSTQIDTAHSAILTQTGH